MVNEDMCIWHCSDADGACILIVEFITIFVQPSHYIGLDTHGNVYRSEDGFRWCCLIEECEQKEYVDAVAYYNSLQDEHPGFVCRDRSGKKIVPTGVDVLYCKHHKRYYYRGVPCINCALENKMVV